MTADSSTGWTFVCTLAARSFEPIETPGPLSVSVRGQSPTRLWLLDQNR